MEQGENGRAVRGISCRKWRTSERSREQEIGSRVQERWSAKHQQWKGENSFWLGRRCSRDIMADTYFTGRKQYARLARRARDLTPPSPAPRRLAEKVRYDEIHFRRHPFCLDEEERERERGIGVGFKRNEFSFHCLPVNRSISTWSIFRLLNV